MVFDPQDTGNARLVWTATADRVWEDSDWAAEREAWENAKREREWAPLMRQTHGVCG